MSPLSKSRKRFISRLPAARSGWKVKQAPIDSTTLSAVGVRE